jgi:hypothetical protein
MGPDVPSTSSGLWFADADSLSLWIGDVIQRTL